MTETRKQIIELIWDYMDKTLSEGCLMKYILQEHASYWQAREKWDILTVIDFYDDWNKQSPYYWSWYCSHNSTIKHFWWKELNNMYWYEIIGHYDITAVLEYISYHKYIEIYTNIGIWEREYSDFINETEIPLKPLHLYTEQEDQDLLELLQHLW